MSWYYLFLHHLPGFILLTCETVEVKGGEKMKRVTQQVGEREKEVLADTAGILICVDRRLHSAY